MATDRGSGSRSRRPAAKKRPSAKKKAIAKKQALKRSKKPRPKTKRNANPIVPVAAEGFVPQLIRVVLALVLMLLAYFTTSTFFHCISETSGWKLWTSAPVFFFAVGLVSLPILLWGAPDGMLYLYVLGHELTHVMFIYLCGGKVVGDIRVSLKGGHVVTTKTNWLIALSPYFIPFYTVLVGSSFLVGSWFIDLGRSTSFTINGLELSFAPIYVMYALIGFTWAMHIYYTLAMIGKNQPDLKMNGTIVSLFLIYLVNLCIIVLFVAMASDGFTLISFAKNWISDAQGSLNQVLVRLAKLIWP